MSDYFIGTCEAFPNANLFCEKPFVAIWDDSKGKNKEHQDLKPLGFESFREARDYCKKFGADDRFPKAAKIYAFSCGEWRRIDIIAH
jgi:hypothetical protein